MSSKVCTRCNVNLPFNSFKLKRNGNYQKQCIQCNEKRRKPKQEFKLKNLIKDIITSSEKNNFVHTCNDRDCNNLHISIYYDDIYYKVKDYLTSRNHYVNYKLSTLSKKGIRNIFKDKCAVCYENKNHFIACTECYNLTCYTCSNRIYKCPHCRYEGFNINISIINMSGMYFIDISYDNIAKINYDEVLDELHRLDIFDNTLERLTDSLENLDVLVSKYQEFDYSDFCFIYNNLELMQRLNILLIKIYRSNYYDDVFYYISNILRNIEREDALREMSNMI